MQFSFITIFKNYFLLFSLYVLQREKKRKAEEPGCEPPPPRSSATQPLAPSAKHFLLEVLSMHLSAQALGEG